MRNGAIASLLVVAVLVGAGAGYLLGNANARTVTFTSLTVSTTTAIENATKSFIYLTANGNCTAKGGVAPCFGSPAYMFNSCPNLLAGPPAPYTCTYFVAATFESGYTLNITLGLRGQLTEPQWANCSWATTAQADYADCIPVINSTAFIVGEPVGSHP